DHDERPRVESFPFGRRGEQARETVVDDVPGPLHLLRGDRPFVFFGEIDVVRDQRFELQDLLAQRFEPARQAALELLHSAGPRRAASAAPASIRSAVASACTRSTFRFCRARRVNSPGSAGRAPAATQAATTSPGTSRPPWVAISIWSSPV